MGKQPAPHLAPARNASEALDNVETLLRVRNAGWDRIAVRDIIHVCYGNTEEFVKHHRLILREAAQREP